MRSLPSKQSLTVFKAWELPCFADACNEPGVLKSVNSPYCIKDYKKLNTRYGTKKDLKELVDAAHAKGMKVILDWVANHTSWDNAWVTEHPDWYTQDANGNVYNLKNSLGRMLLT